MEIDWPEKMVYVTPDSHRVFTKSSVMNDSKEKLISEEDRHYVFVRSKAIVDRQALYGTINAARDYTMISFFIMI